MARFPKRETDIERLAKDVVKGLTEHTDVFPAPPVAPDDITTSLASYNDARDAAIEAAAAAKSGTAVKDDALDTLVEQVKSDLRYAESIARGDSGKLQLVGWGGRRSPTPNDLPGQARTLEVMKEGDGWLFLDWKEPTDGGLVSAYKVQRRKREGGKWTNVGTAVESQMTLNGQEQGVEFEYQVMALNKTGEGPPSNIVRAVL